MLMKKSGISLKDGRSLKFGKVINMPTNCRKKLIKPSMNGCWKQSRSRVSTIYNH